MKTSIVIPNWNGAKKLEVNLPRVIKIARSCRVEEVIIVDDASTDDSLPLIKNDFSEITLIEKKHNSGFASTANLGVARSKGEVVILLNSDAVPADDFLTPALKHFKNPQVFSVSCNVGGLWATGRFEKGYFWHGEGKLKNVNVTAFHQTLWASGGSGIFKKDIWHELGGFDTLFDPFYEEDVDLGFRATKMGYINIWDSQSRVEHYRESGVILENFSNEQISQIAQRNQLIFIWKNITSQKLINQHKVALVKMIFTHPKYFRVFLKALVKLPRIISTRNYLKRQAKLTDEEVFALFA